MKIESYEQAGLRRTYTQRKARFGSRIGFAYRTLDGRKSFAVRGGYSLAYFPIPLWTFVDRMFVNTPMSAAYQNSPNNAAQSPDGIPNYLLRTAPQIVAGVECNQSRQGARHQPRHRPNNLLREGTSDLALAYVELHAGERIGADMVARSRYVGNHGSNLEQYFPYNNPPDYIWHATSRQPLPTGVTSGVVRRPFDNTFWGDLQEYNKRGWSNHEGLEFDLEKRFGNGISFQFSYVLGNALALTHAWSSPVGLRRAESPPELSTRPECPKTPCSLDGTG